MIVHDKDEIGGPLNQFSTIGYKFETNGATILYPERLLRIMSCSQGIFRCPINILSVVFPLRFEKAGEAFIIPKGLKCEVPDYIADELQRAIEAGEQLEITISDLKGKAK